MLLSELRQPFCDLFFAWFVVEGRNKERLMRAVVGDNSTRLLRLEASDERDCQDRTERIVEL